MKNKLSIIYSAVNHEFKVKLYCNVECLYFHGNVLKMNTIERYMEYSTAVMPSFSHEQLETLVKKSNEISKIISGLIKSLQK
jgi:hypothetical protein